MSDRRDRNGDYRGQSSFARRGLSTEERMPEDDAAQRFPGRPDEHGARRTFAGPRSGPHYGRDPMDAPYDGPPQRSFGPPERGFYGSGGSYGYGGSFEHEGQRGYREIQGVGPDIHAGEQFYERTGGFGRDTGGYARHGLGYPGSEEDRYGTPGGRSLYRGRGYINEDSNRMPSGRRAFQEDARRGFSQESGYWQSGGNRVGAQGSGYGDASQHADRDGHEGGGTRAGRGSQQPPRGRYYGRMPQGYTRSDERIRDDLCDQLSHGHIDPSDVRVTVTQGTVVLEGFVESREDKFHAEELAESILGVKDVDNRLRLRRNREQATAASGSSETAKTRAGNNENGARGG